MKLMSRMKWQDFQPFGSRCRKTNLWTKVANLAKPQGRKWHFTQKKTTITTNFYLGSEAQTLEIVRAGLHCSFRISRQMLPLLLMFGWKTFVLKAT
ncbi:hypothetical protein Hanom_Chr03g00264661 [Helianthus anomalus]